MKRQVKLLYHGPVNGFSSKDSIAQWQSVSGAMRLKETWKLAEEIWLLKGKTKDELRFQRSVALIKRPSR